MPKSVAEDMQHDVVEDNDTVEETDTIVMEEVSPEDMTKEELIQQNTELKAKLEEVKDASGGRKGQVLKYLQENGHCRVTSIAKHLNISDRNVSSQMTYLRKDGHAIATDSRGYKFLE